MTPEQRKTLNEILQLSGHVRIVSLVGASLVLVILLAIGLYKPKLVDRVSLRLQAGVALIDILFGVIYLVYYKEHSDGVCSFIGFANFFVRHLYFFVNLSIAINLQLVFLHEVAPSPKYEYLYWGGSLALALILDLPLYAINYFGYDGKRYCLLRSGKVNSPLILNLSINSFLTFTFIYCLVVVILVVIKLNRNIDLLETNCTYNENLGTESRTKLKIFMKKLIYRVSLYPIVCMSTQLGALVYIVHKLASDEHPYGINIWSAYGLALAGILNFIAFLFDPTLHIAIGVCYKAFKAIYMKPSIDNSIELAFPINNGSQIDSKTVFGEEHTISDELLIENTSHY